MTNFDEVVNRRGIFAQKWDDQSGEYIPMWVADMDFRIPDPITRALNDRIQKGTFGFSFIDEGMYDTIIAYYAHSHQCEVKREWIVFVPSVMPGANLACRLAGGDIMLNTPMYPHIRRLPQERIREFVRFRFGRRTGAMRWILRPWRQPAMRT
ncbi:MAG: hypothetical protein LUE63_04370 [Lachnospiraceae bacterium]|nr:hypothetical protein [Lachnospiraceae bacterium]